MDITRNDDGTLVVPVEPGRTDETDADEGTSDESADALEPSTRVLHPGEGGYDEALAAWDLQQDPDRAPAVSTSSGREAAMHLLHEVSGSPDQAIEPALEDVDDAEAIAEALRHVLVGGVPSVEGFAQEIADTEGGEPLPAHEATRLIGEVLAALD